MLLVSLARATTRGQMRAPQVPEFRRLSSRAGKGRRGHMVRPPQRRWCEANAEDAAAPAASGAQYEPSPAWESGRVCACAGVSEVCQALWSVCASRSERARPGWLKCTG